jgi:uncharacterized membrane protein YfcA
MIYVGYLLALMVGITLGLMGSGGSILTVPILHYVLDVDVVTATAYSLFIVGSAAMVGAVRHALQKNIDYRTMLLFGIPSMVAVYCTRLFLVPQLPDTLISTGSWVLTKEDALLLLFAVLMVLAAIRMIRPDQQASTDSIQQPSSGLSWGLMLQGLGVGMLSGLVGAGGGFLMIPAMVLLAKIPMKKAVGTSLAVIAAQSLIGFTGDLQQPKAFDWTLILLFTSMAILGIFIGMWLNRFFSGDRLKTGFGWFVLAMGVYILFSKLIGF